MDLLISSLALVVALIALAVTLASQQTQQHYHAHTECRRVIGHDGRKRDKWSFSGGWANTLIGQTVGRVYVGLASARFDRQQRKRDAADV
jgi:CDP-diacylglycerol pyrophosphatase